MSTEIAYIDSYTCPHCRTELQTAESDWQGWQRCPKCGLPSLPPEPPRPRDHKRLREAQSAADPLAVTDLSDSSGDHSAESASEVPVAHVSGLRVILRTGLVVSAVLAFIFFLDRRTTNMLIFAALTVIFFVLLSQLPRPGRSAS